MSQWLCLVGTTIALALYAHRLLIRSAAVRSVGKARLGRPYESNNGYAWCLAESRECAQPLACASR